MKSSMSGVDATSASIQLSRRLRSLHMPDQPHALTSTSIREEILRLLEESKRLKEQAQKVDEEVDFLTGLVKRSEARRGDSASPAKDASA